MRLQNTAFIPVTINNDYKIFCLLFVCVLRWRGKTFLIDQVCKRAERATNCLEGGTLNVFCSAVTAEAANFIF